MVFFRGTNFVGETDNLERFGRETVVDATGQTVGINLKADCVLYHNFSD